MPRNIYTVYAYVIDANGAFSILQDYPKSFDSNNYNGDMNKAYQRAQGDFFDVWSAMCKRDDRQLQVVTLLESNGSLIDRKCDGFLLEPENNGGDMNGDQ